MTSNLNFSGKTVLVTGGSGFIGSALREHLHCLDAEVHAISRRPPSLPDDQTRWWKGDLGDYTALENVFGTVKPEIAFHLASEVTGKRDIDLVIPTLNNNLISTVNLLTAATKSSCGRIVIAGSLEEPDSNEQAPVPSSPYAAAKWASSSYARMYHALYETPVVIARLFMVYGPGQKDLSKLIPYVALSAQRQESPKLASGGRLVDWIYVEDVVKGLLTSAMTKNIEGQTLDFGSGKLETTGRVAEILCELAGHGITPTLGAVSDRPMEQIRCADINHTYEKTGWKPAISLAEGLKITAEWYWRQARTAK